jgi:acyl-coenzyme A synthetase/AMP-(fatty) acid ligase
VDDLPRTASGKVKKFELQAQLADALADTDETVPGQPG